MMIQNLSFLCNKNLGYKSLYTYFEDARSHLLSIYQGIYHYINEVFICIFISLLSISPSLSLYLTV